MAVRTSPIVRREHVVGLVWHECGRYDFEKRRSAGEPVNECRCAAARPPQRLISGRPMETLVGPSDGRRSISGPSKLGGGTRRSTSMVQRAYTTSSPSTKSGRQCVG